MRRNEEKMVRAVLEWKPTGMGPRGWPRKRQMYIVEEDLKKIEVREWRTLFQNRKKQKEIVKMVKTLRVLTQCQQNKKSLI